MFLAGSNCSVRLSSFVASSFNMEASARSPPSDMPVAKVAKTTSPPPSEKEAEPLATPESGATLAPRTAWDALMGGSFSETEPSTLKKPAAAQTRPAMQVKGPGRRVRTKRSAADVAIEIARAAKTKLAEKAATAAKVSKSVKAAKEEIPDDGEEIPDGQEDEEEEIPDGQEEIPNGQEDPADIEMEDEEEEEDDDDAPLVQKKPSAHVQKKPSMHQPKTQPKPKLTEDDVSDQPKDRVKARKFMKLYNRYKAGDETAMPEWIARAYEDAKADKTGRMQDRVREITNSFMARDGNGNLVTNEDNPKLNITRKRINRTEFNLHSGGYYLDNCLHRIAARLGSGPGCQIASIGLPPG